jgi:hypothetical protein
MSSEWMKVMLDEIARKKAESEQARGEEQRRSDERQRALEQPGKQEQQEPEARRERTVPKG